MPDKQTAGGTAFLRPSTSSFPVFIGITGKRRLSPSPDQAAQVERSVRARLAAVFDHIESLLPNTTKVLLTGLAAGADSLAAQEVLRADPRGQPRKNWLVLAALPFGESMFNEDFSQEEWSAYETVARDPRTRRWVLPPLTASESEDSKDLRRKHYEQVGLWIAETANVLVAVMPAGEEPGKIGGTARVVAHRRGVPPDVVATQVLSASGVLSVQSELQRLSSGFVWLIDPAHEEKGTVPVRVLPPHDEEDDDVPHGPQALLERSLGLLARARRFERSSTQRGLDANPVSSWRDAGDPASVLLQYFNALGTPADRAAKISRNTFNLLAVLFLASFVTFEVFAKFLSDDWKVLALYVAFLSATIGLYAFARWRQWQPVAEDRRAVREALRVQLAWWHAGLKQRVFDFYLQGADRELARVREGVRNLVTMAELSASGAGSHTDWKQVFDLGDRKPLPAGGHIADHPRDWIGSQLAYFELRHRQREARHRFTEALSWILFLTSGLLSVLLLCGLWLGKRHMLPPVLASEHADPVGATALVVGSIAFASACWWGFAKARPTPDPVVRIGLATVFGLFAAIALGVALRSMAVTATDPHWLAPALLVSGMAYGGYWVARVLPDVNRRHPAKTAAAMGAILMTTLGLLAVASRFSDHFGHHPNTDLLTEYMAILVIAFLPALAGALRFVSEKMAVEAEALSYRDALGWFEKAARLLTEARPGQGHPEADARARGIVLHLGKLALQESQQWLKSRRERPLTPLIGG